jgi:hypothetical protein
MSKGKLRYAVLFADGTWGGMFSTEKQALGCIPKRIGERGDEECIGVFCINGRMTALGKARQSRRTRKP